MKLSFGFIIGFVLDVALHAAVIIGIPILGLGFIGASAGFGFLIIVTWIALITGSKIGYESFGWITSRVRDLFDKEQL